MGLGDPLFQDVFGSASHHHGGSGLPVWPRRQSRSFITLWAAAGQGHSRPSVHDSAAGAFRTALEGLFWRWYVGAKSGLLWAA